MAMRSFNAGWLIKGRIKVTGAADLTLCSREISGGHGINNTPRAHFTMARGQMYKHFFFFFYYYYYFFFLFMV